MLLSIKLGSCLTWSDRTLERVLKETLDGCNRAKNAAVTQWYLNHRNGATKFDWDKSYYHAGRERSRSVNSNIMSSCISEVQASLKSKVPYNFDGHQKYRWQAVLDNAISLPTYRGGSFCIPSSGYRIGYEGKVNKPDAKMRSQSSCVIKLPLLSRESGFRNISPFVHLNVGKLSAGHKDILRQCVDPDGEFLCCDARLAIKDGVWYLRLPYKERDPDKTKLVIEPGDAVVTLLPNDHRDRNPFRIVFPNGRSRYVGLGYIYEREYRRLQDRRAVMQFKYRNSAAGKGHGRERYFAKVRPLTRAWQCLVDRFEKQIISDVVTAVRKSNAVGVVYREPTIGSHGLRTQEWYAHRNLPFSWSEFELKLKAKLAWEKIAYESSKKTRLGTEEYRHLYGLQKLQAISESGA